MVIKFSFTKNYFLACYFFFLQFLCKKRSLFYFCGSFAKKVKTSSLDISLHISLLENNWKVFLPILSPIFAPNYSLGEKIERDQERDLNAPLQKYFELPLFFFPKKRDRDRDKNAFAFGRGSKCFAPVFLLHKKAKHLFPKNNDLTRPVFLLQKSDWEV